MHRVMLPLVGAAALAITACGGSGNESTRITTSEIQVPNSAQQSSGGSQDLPLGALPAGFRYRYASGFRGWPVAPFHREHPIRGAFLEPRQGGYHFGVDIPVDDVNPDPGAPPGRSHRVYALDSGYAGVRGFDSRLPCKQRRVQVGQFAYWHVDPTVADGEYVSAGQPLGWTCASYWHLHLAEWAMVDGERVWVNPLHRGGKLIPYRNTSVPAIGSLHFFAPERQAWQWLEGGDSATELRANALRGRVELRVRVEDRESFTGWLKARDPHVPVPEPPYRLAVRITDPKGHAVFRRVAFQADHMPETPAAVLFAPGTGEDLSLRRCIALAYRVCKRQHWYRPFSRQRVEYWNTRTTPDGAYIVTVTAWDIRGNSASSAIRVVVANRSEGGT